MNLEDLEKNTVGKAIGSLILGLISIFGLMFIQEGTALCIAGLILGIDSLNETIVNQLGRKLSLVGIVFNLIGLIGFITLIV